MMSYKKYRFAPNPELHGRRSVVFATPLFYLLALLTASLVLTGCIQTSGNVKDDPLYTWDYTSTTTYDDDDEGYGTTYSSATSGEQNALEKANSYLSFTAFSYSGLVKQLEYEGFSHSEATYAADNCGADWNEQAAKKARKYLDMTSFSRSGLVKQLEHEGFTQSQAEYGVSKEYDAK